MKVYLIGYMGSGKTTVGKLAAEKLQLEFLDMDEEIEQRTGHKISEIFKLLGEEEFRKMEKNLLEELSGKDKLLISTGGGCPCFFDNMEKMNESGLTIYIQFSPKALSDRLKETNISKRPLLEAAGENLETYIAETLAKREPFYTKAHFTISGTDDELVTQILDLYFSNLLG